MSRKSSTRARQSQRKRPTQPSTEAISEQPIQKKSRPWPWIIGAFLVLLIGIGCWHGIASNAPSAVGQTSPGSNVSPWKTLQAYSGPTTNNVDQKLQQFQVSGNWQITWACQGINGVDEELLISIYNSNGTLFNAGTQLTCLAAKQVTGSLPETQSGTFYLVVNSSTSWKVSVQILT